MQTTKAVPSGGGQPKPSKKKGGGKRERDGWMRMYSQSELTLTVCPSWGLTAKAAHTPNKWDSM